MKELAGTSANVFFEKNTIGETKPIFEIIIITSEPDYELSNVREVVKVRKVETFRFWTRNPEQLASSILACTKDLMGQTKKTEK